MKEMRGLLSGASWTAAMKLITAGVSFGFFVVVARRWGPDPLGELALLYAVFVVLQQLPLMGLQYLLIRDLAQHKGDPSRLIANVAVIGGGVALGLCVVLGIFAARSPETAPDIILAYWCVGLALIPSAFISVAEAMLVAREHLARVAQISVLESLLRTVIWLVLVLLGGSLFHIAVVLLVGRIVTFAVYWRTTEGYAETMRTALVSSRDLGRLLSASPPFLGILLLTACISRLDFLVLSRMSGAEALGFYSAPYRIFEGVLMVPQALSVALAPRFARAFASLTATERHPVSSDSHVTHRESPPDELVRIVCRGIVLLGIPGALVLLILATPIMRVFYGTTFEVATPVLSWMAFVPVLAALDQCLGIVLVVTEHQRADLAVLAVSTALYALALVLLIPLYGFVGAAMATCLTALLQVSVRYWAVRRRDLCRSLVPVLAPPGVAGATALLTVLAQPSAPVMFRLMVGLGVYVAMCIVLRAVTGSDLRAAKQILRTRQVPQDVTIPPSSSTS